MNKLNFIKLIAKTDRPERVDAEKFGLACREAVEFAFKYWIGDNGQNHAKNAKLIDACVKKRDELLGITEP